LEIPVLLEGLVQLGFMEVVQLGLLEMEVRLVRLARLVYLVQLAQLGRLVELGLPEVEVITELLVEMDQLGRLDGLDRQERKEPE
jgi:hypothetical protein